MVIFMSTERSNRPARVMLSVSEPDTAELRLRGLDEIHVRHAFIEIVRHLLAAGHSISYGGDLRPAGYTETVVDLLRTYRRQGIDVQSRFTSYLAWPAQRTLTAEALAALRSFSTPVLLTKPNEAQQVEPEAASPLQLLAIAAGYSAMRQQIVEETDCLLVLGGRTFGQIGLVPGVQEEVLIALRRPIPVFVCGGFGGSGAAVSSALSGQTEEAFSVEYHLTRTPSYESLLTEARRVGGYTTPGEIGDELRKAGWERNQNRLTEQQNSRLAVSDDVDEIIALVLRGIRLLTQA